MPSFRTINMLIRNLFFYLGLIPITILFTILGLLFFFLPYQQRYYLITRWSHFFIFWAKVIGGLNYSVEGIKNLPTQTAIVFSNHQSMWETIFMQLLLPNQTWILKKQLLNIPVFGWGLRLLNPIAIDRKSTSSIKQLLTEGEKRLKSNVWVVIFPEGTRVAPGVKHRYSRSGAMLAEATGSQVVPIAHNAGLFWPRGFWIKKTGTIQVAIAPPIDPKDKKISEINELAEHWIRAKTQQFNKDCV